LRVHIACDFAHQSLECGNVSRPMPQLQTLMGRCIPLIILQYLPLSVTTGIWGPIYKKILR